MKAFLLPASFLRIGEPTRLQSPGNRPRKMQRLASKLTCKTALPNLPGTLEAWGLNLRRSLIIGSCCLCLTSPASAPPANGFASWYGEAHRGKLMANGKRFDPDKLTAASWFYPLGTKVRVSLESSSRGSRTVLVTITDRGPATDLVREGRIIDLAYGAFKRLGEPDLGLVPVTVHAVRKRSSGRL